VKRRWLLVLLTLPILLMSRPAYAAGAPVELSVQPNADGTITSTVTNTGDRPCRLAAMDDGILTITSVRHDGRQPDPEYRSQSYLPNYQTKLQKALRSVEPGQSITFTSPVQTVAIAGGDGTASRWTLTEKGTYELRAVYRMPTAAGADACQGSSNVATATLTIGSGDSGRPLLLFIGAGVLGLVVLLLIFVLAIRRSHRSAVALMLIGLLACGAAAVHPGRADASLEVPAEASSCLTLIKAHDPAGLFKDTTIKRNGQDVVLVSVDDPNYRVRIHIIHDGNNETSAGAWDADISWDPNYTEKFAEDPTVAAYPCASLYHELTHAYDGANHQLDIRHCMHGQQGKTVIMTPTVKEIHATRVENAFRAALLLPPRTGYLDHGDLPPGTGTDLASVQNDCKPSPPDKPSKGRDTSRLKPAGPTGHSNGDPHLATFDQRYYDFQASGEFVLTKGPGLEVQVRQQPLDGSRVVSVNSATAMRIGSDRVTFEIADNRLTIRVNGNEQAVTGEVKLPGGGTISTEDDNYFVDSPDGSEVSLLPIGAWGLKVDVYPAAALKGKLTGLLGNLDDDPANDLPLPDGSQLAAEPTRDQLYGAFADAYRVHDSLFDYQPGQTTDTFTDRTFPDRVVTVADLTASQRDAARAVCTSYGLTAADLDGCIIDLALTGQAAFAATTTPTSTSPAAESPTPTPTPTTTEPSVTPRPGTTQTLADGAKVSGKLDKPGQVDTYRLSLGTATIVRLADVTGDEGDLNLQLTGPSGLDTPGFTVTSNYQFRIQRGGTYSLQVSGGTGAYGFRLVTAKERRLTAALGQQVSGNLDVPGRVDLYAFTVPREMKVTLSDGSGCDFAAAIVEDGPQPHSYSPTTPCDGINLGTLTPGTHYLTAIWSPDAKTGPYSFHLTED
jgi:hypothetical protein